MQVPRTTPQRCYLSIGGKAVEPADATGGVERRLAAPLAHMHRIPRHVPAPGAVRVAEHGARTLCWEVRIRLWQRQAIRGPVAAGVIETVGERPALGVRTGQSVMLILRALRDADAWNYLPFDVEHIRLLHVVAVALLVTMQIGDIAGDQHTLDVEPGPGADAIPRVHARRVAPLFLTEIGAPSAGGVRAAEGLSLALTHLVGAGEPAKIARLVGVRGNEEAYHRRRCGRLLGLRHQRCRSQKRGRSGEKDDHFVHCGNLPWVLFNASNCVSTLAIVLQR